VNKSCYDTEKQSKITELKVLVLGAVTIIKAPGQSSSLGPLPTQPLTGIKM